MGYHVLDPGDLDATPDRPSTRKALSDAADLERVSVNYYVADPGEQIPLAYHYHDEQEEVFYVIDGPMWVETPDRTYTVPTDAVFVAEAGSPHRAFNDEGADGPARVLAIGAPRSDDGHRYGDGS